MSHFSERIRTRRRVWWGVSPSRSVLVRHRRPLHRLVELNARRRHDDPEARWRCCQHWQRTVTNKWNGREFARRHGFRVPALYWIGRRTAALPVAALPENFIVRPMHGSDSKGVWAIAGGRDLLSCSTLARRDLTAALRRSVGRISRWPLLVEEFVRSEAGEYRLPIEYKCYTFGSTVGAIEVVQPTRRHTAQHRFYTPDWEPFDDPVQLVYPRAGYSDAPRCLADILRCATTLGTAFGTFVRIDCYATDAGCVFGEISTTPMDGHGFTPFADAYFGALWDAAFPDAI